MARVLILGGTGDAMELAAKLADIPSLEIMTSLAGRTRQPLIPVGDVRSGGFGGAAGLITYLQTYPIDALVDATHPFAAQMSWNAAAAAAALDIPLLRLERPAWSPEKGDRWMQVATVEAAVSAIPAEARRVFLTIGRQQLAPFAGLKQPWFLMRAIDPPGADQPLPRGKLLLDRGPFDLNQERQLLVQYQIDAIVSKNSGGHATYAKIIAARERQIPVVMVQRPVMPSGATVAADAAGAITWLTQTFSTLSIPSRKRLL